MMKDLVIYHPGTGTLISLSDEVYLVDVDKVREDILEEMEDGGTVDERDHYGLRLDNYSMTNYYYEGDSA